jgi:hypothetical protein
MYLRETGIGRCCEELCRIKVTLDGDEKAAARFYLEDLAIGLMCPILNVDVER